MQTTQTAAPAITSAYEAALSRARKNGISICGRGRRKSDGAPVIAVSSASQPGIWHVVVVLPTRLVCDCLGGRRGKLCTHRAVVHAELIRLWRKERDRIEAEEEAKLHEALRELVACQGRVDAALRHKMSTCGDAPTLSQEQASALLLPPLRRPATLGTGSARVYRPDVARLDDAADVSPRLLDDNRPISIWK